jgi:hypothetical protein
MEKEIMWKELDEAYVKQSFFNSKTKKEFMEKIGIHNRDYRACKRAIRFFKIEEEKLGCELCSSGESKNRKIKKDIIGEKFGKVEVISINTEKTQLHNRTYYNCLCHECGEYCIKRTDNLNSNVIDCGCSKKQEARLKQIIDITGQFFGEIEVLELDTEKTFENSNLTSKVYWKCKCHRCGNFKSILGISLKNGTSLSCGCSHKEVAKNFLRKDISGQIFGYLKAIEPDEKETIRRRKKNGGKTWWKCECLKCGNMTSKNGVDLRLGNAISCGCSKESKGELLIEKFLKDKKIQYKKQYSFEDLIGKERTLKFDFAVFNNNKIFTLIEFQGEQHYVAKDFFGGETQLKRQQEYDQKKRNYCKNNKIKLLEIPYHEIENIDSILSKELREVILCR